MRALPAVALLVVCAASGCHLFDFDLTRSIPQQHIPGDPIAAQTGVLLAQTGAFPNPFAFDLNISQEEQAHGTGPTDWVHMKSLTLTMDPSSPEKNFDFVDELHVLVASTKSGTTLPQVEVASLVPVPKGQSTLVFAVDSTINLLPYVKEGTRVSSSGKARVPARDVIFAGQVVFRVKPI